MEEQNNDQQRELNHWLATLLTAVSGIVGGALGILTALSWGYFIPAVLGLNQFTASLYFVIPMLALVTGPIGAIAGGWAAGRWIDKFERQPHSPKFKDKRAGGIITFVVKVLIWVAILIIVGLPLLLMGRG